MARASHCAVGTVTLDTQSAVLPASRSESSPFAVLVHGVDNPVDAGVVSDGNVLGINHNYFKILVCGILVHPVRVQYTEVSANSTSTLLCNTAQVSGKLLLVDTGVTGLSMHDPLVQGTLAATTANCNAVHNVALEITE